jgi:hypothetical protein
VGGGKTNRCIHRVIATLRTGEGWGCVHREMPFPVFLVSLFACCHLISPLFSETDRDDCYSTGGCAEHRNATRDSPCHATETYWAQRAMLHSRHRFRRHFHFALLFSFGTISSASFFLRETFTANAARPPVETAPATT